MHILAEKEKTNLASLLMPWCAFGSSLSGAALSESRKVAVALAGLVAVALPAVFARTLIKEQSCKAEELLQHRRLAQAQVLVRRLCDLGSDQPLLGKPPGACCRGHDEDSLRRHAAD